MNTSIYNLKPHDHIKIVVIALLLACLTAAVGILARPGQGSGGAAMETMRPPVTAHAQIVTRVSSLR